MPAAMTSTADVPDSTAASMSALRSSRYCCRANDPMLCPSRHERDAGCSARARAVSARHVVDEAVPAGGAEVPVACRVAGRAAVAAVVVGVDDVAGVDQRLGERGAYRAACSPIPWAICTIAFGSPSPAQRYTNTCSPSVLSIVNVVSSIGPGQ